MTDHPEGLKARSERASDRSPDHEGEAHGPLEPETLAAMARAVRSLSKTTRQIFLARCLDGFSYAHIAQVTGLSKGQVERHIAAAIYRIGCHVRGNEPPPRRRWWQSLLCKWHR